MEVVQHSALTGADLHSPKTHAASHENGGADLLQDVAAPFGIHGSSPALNFYDTDCTDSDINAQILVAATDTGSGSEDVDIDIRGQRAGTDQSWIFIDADLETVFNNDGLDQNFRVESSNNANMLFVDAGNDCVGFGIVPVAGTRITLPQENDEATPTFAFGDGDTGLLERIDDALRIVIAGTGRWEISGDFFAGVASQSPAVMNETPSSTNPTLCPSQSDLDTGIGLAGADQLSLIAGGVEVARLETTGMRVKKAFGLDARTTLVISSGVVTFTKSYHSLDTEGAAGTDDLDTITATNAVDGDIVVLRPTNAARVVTLKDGTGNLRLTGDFALSGSSHLIVLLYDGTNWAEISRSAN